MRDNSTEKKNMIATGKKTGNPSEVFPISLTPSEIFLTHRIGEIFKYV